jgi:hypothetical protein
MKTVKLFEQFVNESRGSEFSHAVLTALEPTILEMVENIKAQIIEQYAKKNETYTVSAFEERMIYLGLIVDMLKSFEKYTEPTDKLIKIQANIARKGVEIYAVVERDGVQYDYFTEAIGAGGYNIQSYHYRYLTKTKLPNGKIKGTLSNEYAEQLKKLTKVEKMNAEIKSYQVRIERNNEIIQASLGFTDEEILAKVNAGDNIMGKPYQWPTWAEIVKNGAAKNYNNDEAAYNKQKSDAEADSIEFWKRRNIKWNQENNKALEKNISKLEAKLAQITSQS